LRFDTGWRDINFVICREVDLCGHRYREPIMSLQLDEVISTLNRASELAALRQDEAALPLYRSAVRNLLSLFQKKIEGETLRTLLFAFRGLAVTAFVTGHSDEGRVAVGTALAYANQGLKYWVDAPPLLEERAVILKLAEKAGGEQVCPVLVPDGEGEWTWPFES
jgi:hypothetical protein